MANSSTSTGLKYSYYPGCSLERNAASYNTSTLAIARALGLELVEIDDWNCCGATEYISLNLTASFALVARNLALAASMPGLKDLVAPCSACYLNLRKTDTYMREDKRLGKVVNTALAEGGLNYTPGSVRPRHLLDVVVNDVGYETLAQKVTRPLAGLRVAPYYGCMIVRPEFMGGSQPAASLDDPEFPTSLDKLLQALGADVVDYPLKAQCCGGHMTQISESTAFDLIRRLIKGAADLHADMIVTLCPMCQLNLDAYQAAMNAHYKTDYKIPVVYFTQMLGVAFGIDPSQLGFGSELVDPRPALAKIGVEAPQPEAPAKKPAKDNKSLPMPQISNR